MTRSVLVLCLSVVVLAAGGSIVRAQEGPPPAPAAPTAEEPPTFDEHMGIMNRAFRKLRRSDRNAETLEADLAQVGHLQAAIVGAKSLVEKAPMAGQASEKFGEDRAAYLTAFRLVLNGLLAETVGLEKALLEGRAEAAEKLIAKIKELQDQGHDAFQQQW